MSPPDLNNFAKDVVQVAPFLSFLVAALALFVSFSSYRLARRSLRLAVQREERQKSAFFAYLEDASAWTRSSDGKRLYAFLITIANRSDSNDAIARAHLLLSLQSEKGTLDYKVPFHQLDEPLESGLAKNIKVPLRLDARQAETGWIAFGMNSAALSGKRVRQYTLVLEHSGGGVTTLRPALIKERDSQHEAKAQDQAWA